jgi:hypothetical protein
VLVGALAVVVAAACLEAAQAAPTEPAMRFGKRKQVDTVCFTATNPSSG